MLTSCCRLICAPDNRLGRNGAQEIREHPFFTGVDWNSIRNIDAPFVPHLKSVTDTSYFPTEECVRMWRAAEPDADFRLVSSATRTCRTCRAAQTLALAPRATSPSWASPSGATWTSATGRSTRLPQRTPSMWCICRRASTLCGAEEHLYHVSAA